MNILGKTVQSYIAERRIKEALHMIDTSNIPIQNIAKKLVIRISQPFIETLFKSLGSLLQDIKNLLVLELSRTIHNRKSKMVTSFSGLKNSALVETDRETSFLNLEKDHWAYSYNGLAEELGWAWAIRATSVLKTI